jgi:uncharacterized delta-60 repeat protein
MLSHFRLFLTVPLLLVGIASSLRAQSALDGFDPSPDAPVLAVAVQPDGKILIGGSFRVVHSEGFGIKRSGIARLLPDGRVDPTFNPIANDSVRAIALQPDGKILIGGDFTTLSPNNTGPVARARLARLHPDGTIDTTFNADTNGRINVITMHPAGRILVGGDFTSVGGAARKNIARLRAGGLADSFAPNPDGPVHAITMEANGILVGGNFDRIGGAVRINIARLDLSGDVEPFNPQANDSVFAIVIQADGKILVGGLFTHVGGLERGFMARLDPVTGAADSFDARINNEVYTIAVQPDGRILAGGDFTSAGGRDRRNLVRLEPRLGRADAFDPTVTGYVFAIALQQDGKVLVGGDFDTVRNETRNRMARLEIDGRLDRTLNASVIGPAGATLSAIAVQTDGKIVIGGVFSSVLGVTRNNIARLNTDGTLDTAFNPNANSAVIAVAIQPDGKVLAGGFFTAIGGAQRNQIARLDPISGAADTFNPNANGGTIESITVLADGKILIAGSLRQVGSVLRNGMARLDAVSGAPDSFNPNVTGGDIATVVVQPNGKILIGGDFFRIAGQPFRKMARLNVDGTADGLFRPEPEFRVQAIAVQADGKVLAGGHFTTIGGASRQSIARLDPITGAADSFNPRLDNVVLSIAVQSDGKILAGGLFTRIPAFGPFHNRLVRFDPVTGLLDSPLFDANANVDVTGIGLQQDGKVLAGGRFTSIGGQARNLFARLSNDTAALQQLTVTQDTITWTRDGSSPLFTRATFESSPDNSNFTFLGHGTHVGSDWTLTGLNLPAGQNLVIRARGFYRSGVHNGSESVVGSRQEVYFPAAPGRFVIGDRNAVVGQRVIFWGAQWAKSNSLSGGAAPAKFKGYATFPDTNPPACGGAWTHQSRDDDQRPTNLPAQVQAIVASSITDKGAAITGNIISTAIIQPDPGYDGNPGRPTTGTVLSIHCNE